MGFRTKTFLRGKWVPFVIALFLLVSCAGLSISPGARSAFESGLSLFNQGKFGEAAPFFEKALSEHPDYYEAQLYLGRTYLSMKDYGKAIPSLRNAYRLSPDDFKKQIIDILIDALLGAAFSELGKGNFERSLSYLREIVSVDPNVKKVKEDLSNVFVAVATSLLMKGDVREAVKVYGEAIKSDPGNKAAYLGLAKALIKNGNLSDAIEAAQKALSLDPSSNEALNIIRELLK